MSKILKLVKDNPEKSYEITKRVILKNRINEDLQELFYLIPVEKRDIINHICDMLNEV